MQKVDSKLNIMKLH